MNPLPRSPDALSRHGFKQVTWVNLLKQDDHPSHPSSLRDQKWVEECLKPELEPNVPEEVAFLFEVARGAMIYGMFFLPLATLATEEGFRVLEAGVRHRCKQLGLGKKGSAKPHSFPEKPYIKLVMTLHKAGKIPENDLEHWQSMVFLRNRSSHRNSTTIRARHEAISQLSYVAELLNRLFK